jgi:hypothetical protein
LHEMLYAGHFKLLAEVSELFMHAMFQLAVIWKMASFKEPKRWSWRVLNQVCSWIWGRRDMVSVFWDSDRILLVECLERAATINSEWYVQTLKLKQWSWRAQPDRKMNQVLIHHDNTSLEQRRHLQQW